MFNINKIKKTRNKYIRGLQQRKVADAKSTIDKIIDLDDKRKEYKIKLDDIYNKIKILSNSIHELIKLRKEEVLSEKKKEISKLKVNSKLLDEQYTTISKELHSILIELPNIPSISVPSEEEGDKVVFESKKKTFAENLLPHWDLVKKYDLVDFDLGNKISGAGFPVYKAKMAKLQRSLVSFFLDSAIQAGYTEIQVPMLVNEASVFSTGQLPDKEGQMYKVQDNLYLIPTAEVPITNIFRNVILEEKQLPVKYVGYTANFRREIGSWGSNVRGLNRLHQFDKVEIVQIQKPEESYKTLEDMCLYVQSLLDKLEVMYRRICLNVSDLGFASAQTYDIEVYSPGQKKWLEVSSISNFETFQANRLKLRYRDALKNKIQPHTLNGSAIAIPRLVAALLENNQCNEGITIPDPLVKYTGFDMMGI